MSFKSRGFGITPNSMRKNSNIEKKELSKAAKIVLITILTFILILCLYFIYTSFFKVDKSVIGRNIFIENINMEGKSPYDANIHLNKVYSHIKNDPAVFQLGDKEISFSAINFDYVLNIEEATEKAMELTLNSKRDQNKKENINIEFIFNETKLNSLISEILSLLPQNETKERAEIIDNILYIYKGEDPVKISKEEIRNIILNKFKSTSFSEKTDIPLTSYLQEMPDLKEIRQEIYIEAKNATFNRQDGSITNDVFGLDFAVTLEEAQKIYSESDKIAQIPLKVVTPEITTKDLENTLFKDNISTYSLKFDGLDNSTYNNITIATSQLNETIINTNSTFSLLEKLNNLDANSGYTSGTTQTDNGYEQVLGGGVSFVSTVLYNSVLRANLNISERHPHIFKPNYGDLGLDSFVFQGKYDLKFRNNRGNPIKILAQIENAQLTISILGQKLNNEPQINLSYQITSERQIEEQRIQDPYLSPGREEIIQNGSPETTIKIYKETILNGHSSGKKELYTNKYKGIPKIVKYGSQSQSEAQEQQNVQREVDIN